MKKLLKTSVVCLCPAILCLLSYYAGRNSVRDELVQKVEGSSDAILVPGDSLKEGRDLASKLSEEGSDITVPELSATAVSSRFSVFHSSFKVVTKSPKDMDYARRQVKELRNLAITIPSVKSVSVLSLEGIDESGKTYSIRKDP